VDLSTLETLLDVAEGEDLPLPGALAKLYGRIQFPLAHGRPYVVGNFVSTLDGVVSLTLPGHQGGGDISGFNQHDRMVMGLLRAVADAVIVGAGTLRAAPQHRWTPDYVYPALAEDYRQLRKRLGKLEPPLNVIVTASGKIDFELPVFQTREVQVLVATTRRGAGQMAQQSSPPPNVQVVLVAEEGTLSAAAVLATVCDARPSDLILTEGGPRLIGDFLAERCLDELFLTLAPQVAGRDEMTERPGLVSGKNFAPASPLWGKLMSVKRAESHLFLRYAFPTTL
jgi:riboflavin biosynthesis pyrimidine reductase